MSGFKEKIFSLSIDDGHPSDFTAMKLLEKHGIKATFYIPKTNPEREVVSESQVRDIAKAHEIGAHTIRHLSLHKMHDGEAFAEINESKKWVEDVTAKPCISFCYPQGKFNAHTPGLVKKAGFTGARTCMFNLVGTPSNPFLWGLSTHAYSHSPRIQFQHAIIEKNLKGALNYVKIFHLARNWYEHFVRSLEYVDENGGVAHLYFHSWEIEANSQWKMVDAALSAAKSFCSIRNKTNGELFQQ